jgi:CheY-like chemotaxis protein
VDDDQINRLVLRNMLLKSGYDVSEAGNGIEAISVFERIEPDIVLMDVMMPEMDGYEAARRIKDLAGNHFIPVVFLTALTEETALAQCVDSGGDDFLTKPYSRNILKLKLNAALRVRHLYRQLEQYTHKVEKHYAYMKSEQEAAERIFNKMVNRGHLHDRCFEYRLASAALFNGDLLLANRLPAGGYRVMLGDFTGHGLPAAVGAIPVAEMFYTMSEKGRALEELVREMNAKLKKILPSGVFLSACLLDITPDNAKIWNGGIPDVFAYAGDSSLQKVCSQHLPLGILPDREFTCHIQELTLDAGTRIYVYSDGVIEASNENDELYGEDRLLDMLGESHTSYLSALWQSIGEFTGSAEQRDDMSMIEIRPAHIVW